MRYKHCFVTTIGNSVKKIFHCAAAGSGQFGSFDKCSAAAADDSSFVFEEDVSVAAESCVATPLPTGEDDEASIPVESGGCFVDGLPEIVGDLKVIALMPTDIDECAIASEAKVSIDCVRADSFFALAVDVRPEAAGLLAR